VVVNPQETTTYSGYVTGNGGVSPVASVTLFVYYPPTLNVNYPSQLDYNEQSTIEYDGDYANSSVTLTATYNYDYVGSTSASENLNKADSSELGSNSSYSGTYTTDIPYTDRGPLSVTYVITASGDGGSTSETFTIPINVDRTPDNITIEESDNLFKDEVPVFTPNSELLGDYYEIGDVDIQVEIQSDNPINVDVNQQSNWKKVRSIGSGAGGNSMPSEGETLDGNAVWKKID